MPDANKRPKTKKLLVAAAGVATLTFSDCLCFPVANLMVSRCDDAGHTFCPADSGNEAGDGGITDGGLPD